MDELETLIEYHRYLAGGDIPLTDKVKELLNGNTEEETI